MGTMRIFNSRLSISKPWNSGAGGEKKREEIIHKVDKVPYFIRDQLSLFFLKGEKVI